MMSDVVRDIFSVIGLMYTVIGIPGFIFILCAFKNAEESK